MVDRIEGDNAVLELDGATVDWPLAELPAKVVEGSVLTVDWPPAPGAEWTVETGDLAEAWARLARLRARSPQSGDVDL